MYVIFMQVQLLSYLLIGEIQTHQIQTIDPSLERLMVTGEHAVSENIKLATTVGTGISLSSGLSGMLASF